MWLVNTFKQVKNYFVQVNKYKDEAQRFQLIISILLTKNKLRQGGYISDIDEINIKKLDNMIDELFYYKNLDIPVVQNNFYKFMKEKYTLDYIVKYKLKSVTTNFELITDYKLFEILNIKLTNNALGNKLLNLFLQYFQLIDDSNNESGIMYQEKYYQKYEDIYFDIV